MTRDELLGLSAGDIVQYGFYSKLTFSHIDETCVALVDSQQEERRFYIDLFLQHGRLISKAVVQRQPEVDPFQKLVDKVDELSQMVRDLQSKREFTTLGARCIACGEQHAASGLPCPNMRATA